MAGLVRSTLAKKSGKCYWECTIDKGAPSCVIGVATKKANLNNYLGADAYGWGYCGFGAFRHAGKNIGSGWHVASNGDVIGFALDATNCTLQCYINGIKMGSLITGLSTPIYAAAGGIGKSSTTANFGQGPFMGIVPSGYDAGIYEQEDDIANEIEKYPKLSFLGSLLLIFKSIFFDKKNTFKCFSLFLFNMIN